MERISSLSPALSYRRRKGISLRAHSHGWHGGHARCDTGIERLQRAAHKHQRSPGFRPGKPISGTGVLRSLPRDLLNASISSVISAHIIWAPTSSGPVSQQPVRQNPLVGRMEHVSSFSPRTFRSSGMVRPPVRYIVPIIGGAGR
jgi:hypothetical protein